MPLTPTGPAVACPSCGKGNVQATFQVNIGYARAENGALVAVDDGPDTDSFVYADCTNYDECRVALAQEPGDGRLRRAGLLVDGDPDDGDPELEGKWVAAVLAVTGLEE